MTRGPTQNQPNSWPRSGKVCVSCLGQDCLAPHGIDRCASPELIGVCVPCPAELRKMTSKEQKAWKAEASSKGVCSELHHARRLTSLALWRVVRSAQAAVGARGSAHQRGPHAIPTRVPASGGGRQAGRQGSTGFSVRHRLRSDREQRSQVLGRLRCRWRGLIAGAGMLMTHTATIVTRRDVAKSMATTGSVTQNRKLIKAHTRSLL